jgi:hypothetical protein
LELVAHFMDSAIAVPGSKIRFGFDALVGLIPGVGDLVTSMLGICRAALRRACFPADCCRVVRILSDRGTLSLAVPCSTADCLTGQSSLQEGNPHASDRLVELVGG